MLGNRVVHDYAELMALARMIGADAGSWKGVACLSFRPEAGQGMDWDAVAGCFAEAPLCFRDSDSRFYFFGQPGAGMDALPPGTAGVVRDIAAGWQEALALLPGNPPCAGEDGMEAEGGHALSVLLAEDDPVARRAAEGFLARHATTFMAENPRNACANYLVHRPDIVFLDIYYHDEAQDGFDALRGILSCDPDAYVVIASGDRNVAGIYRGLREGAKGFIAKPFHAEDFLRHLAMRRKLRRNVAKQVAQGG